MNNQLIAKIIKSNDINSCPELTYENPLLARNVAGALARSFVKILRVSQQDSNINDNLRYSVLSNIRKICRIEPENHLEVDENFTSSLVEVYMNKITESQNKSEDSLERSLDEFLLRKMKEIDLDSNYPSSVNPEVVQALLNLSENSNLESLSKNILHWNVSDNKTFTLVKELWINLNVTDRYSSSNICDDISIKMKSEIEIILLKLCHSFLTDPNLQTEELFATNNNLKNLVKKCSISPECFQICSGVLNHLFIHTNYNEHIKHLISTFIIKVKETDSNSFSILYPDHLSSIVVLLDIHLNVIPQQYKSEYVKQTLNLLKTLQQTDLVLLLSHFPVWFHIYCS